MNPSTAFALVLTTLVGISIVAQGTVNSQLLRNINLWILLAIGNGFCFVSSLIGFAVTRGNTTLGGQLALVPARVLIPSVSGLIITSCMPIAIGRIGVPSAITVVIAVQILASLAWEQFGGTGTISAMRLCGAALVFLGSMLVVRG